MKSPVYLVPSLQLRLLLVAATTATALAMVAAATTATALAVVAAAVEPLEVVTVEENGGATEAWVPRSIVARPCNRRALLSLSSSTTTITTRMTQPPPPPSSTTAKRRYACTCTVSASSESASVSLRREIEG